ncbi:MAG: hypothetical protein MUE46_10190 [Xanthomonadales bacterium]|jgi:hypothetical protein|nr:hypothetical protein [Xanthomonadales bacterium]
MSEPVGEKAQPESPIAARPVDAERMRQALGILATEGNELSPLSSAALIEDMRGPLDVPIPAASSSRW